MNRLLILFFCLLCGSAAAADPDNAGEAKGSTGLPLPRFASLRSDEVNLRTGPGTRYPIEWVFVRTGMPVEITAEYDIWRRVRDWEGSEGWVHKSVLSGRRMAVITGKDVRELRGDKNSQAAIVAHLEPGAVGQLLSCEKEWCHARFGEIKGYLPKTNFWGVYANEAFD